MLEIIDDSRFSVTSLINQAILIVMPVINNLVNKSLSIAFVKSLSQVERAPLTSFRFFDTIGKIHLFSL